MRILIGWNQLSESELDLIKETTQAELILCQDKEQANRHISQADIAFGAISPDSLAKAVNLQWLQVPYAGVERLVGAKWGNDKMILTNGSGIFGPCIAEHVIGMMLSFTRGLHIARDQQKTANWQWEYPFRELSQATVGILGYGNIGSEVAKRLQPFGVRIVGFRLRPTGTEQFADQVLSIDDLDSVLPQLDYLICALPHTPKTVGLLNLARLSRLQPHSIVINVGRGSLINQEDLQYALENQVIAGAGLDVTSPEPLPETSSLWGLPNIIITPHNSGNTPFHRQRAIEIFLTNWQAFSEGRPMINVVDKAKGY